MQPHPYHYLALLAAAGLVMVGPGPAEAADIGGDCCADLEERIAELEATTARKGNRKVSLTVYGQVNEAVFFWDDGVERNATEATNDNSRSRFGFKGEAKINGDWKAGYVLEIGVRGNNSKRFNQVDHIADFEDRGLDIRHSRWYLESKQLGTVSVGVTPTSLEAVTEANLAHTKDVAKYSDVEDSGLGLFLRTDTGLLSTSPVEWRRLIKQSGDQPGEGERRPAVWYFSPEYHGFHVEAGWGADDSWDVGLKYKGEWGDFKAAAGIGYGVNTDDNFDFGAIFDCVATDVAGQPDTDCQTFGGSVSVMHEPTGIYVNFAAGELIDDTVLADADFAGTGASDSSTFWAIEAGIEKKWCDLGKTTIFGQYYDFDGGANERLTVAEDDPLNPLGADANVFSSGLQMWGGGVVQELSSAAMLIYAYYRRYEGELTLANDGDVAKANAFHDLDVAVAGGIIKF